MPIAFADPSMKRRSSMLSPSTLKSTAAPCWLNIAEPSEPRYISAVDAADPPIPML